MSKPFNLDRTVRLLIAVAIVIVAIWLLGVLKNALLPFFLACLISYILEPLVELNQSLLGFKKRVPAVFITLADGLVIAAVLFLIFIPIIIKEVGQMSYLLKTYEAKGQDFPFLPENIGLYLEHEVNLKSLLYEFENGRLGGMLNQGANFISTSIATLLHSLEWLITVIYVIFILLDYQRLGTGSTLLIPKKYRPDVVQVMSDVKYYMNKYFRSQLLIACCAAILYSVGFTIVGLPMAIIMGILVGILYMIPYFQYITIIPVAIICFISSLDGHVNFLALLGKCGLVYVISQCICDYVLTPKIMGKSMGLNPAIILLSLSVWGTLLGILGMIIALPLTTLLLVYYKKLFIDHVPLSTPTDPTDLIIPGGNDNSTLSAN